MRKLIVGVAMVLAATARVVAADMSVPMKAPAALPYSWTGFYFGVNAGGHWSVDNDPAYISFNNNVIPANVVLLNQLSPVDLNQSGFAGGAHAGYNWQATNLVLGVEADIDGFSSSGGRNLNASVIGDTAQFMDSARDEWMSTIRARLGWAADRWLIFVTGGAAFSEWQLDHTYTSNGGGPGQPAGTTNGNFFRTGGTAGGGIEYGLNENLSVRAEYLWAGFGHVSQVVNGSVGAFNTAFTNPQSLSENVVRAGITYNFGPH
jgi:outer membrane immunogenic protein